MKELKAPIHNFSIYKSYGDFVVFNFTEGAYYSMKTTVKIKSCEQLIKNEKLNLKCNINLTFPSTIEATLINNNDQSIPLEKRVLIAGSHVVMWKNIPIEFKDSSIEFLTKGLYSNQNILKIRSN